ncbi:MAG: hypothetical protein MPW17_04735 [Candidatus Manganitrophus sp.]|nr:hypothetical protein [Candidatus Manganitrophus sp.]MDC4226693.1 hypothetical protein [Candidatus Manganitrophus sp.]WDT72149.1 MAG: hypothetical protein MPW17_04735 [Candidatus Manganitrophus sp.]
METSEPIPNRKEILEAGHLQRCFDSLKQSGYRLVGPTLENGAIVYDELISINDLPIGWTDAQEGATYRLKKETMPPSSVMPSAPIPGKNISSRLQDVSGAPSAKRTAFESSMKKRKSRSSP